MIYINDMPREFRDGMTIAEAFRENNISLKGPFLIYVNDEVVDYSEYNTFVLHDGDEVQKLFTCFTEM